MHYYQFHIGDYHRDTSHLTLIEDIAYRRLLDRFYLDEKPLQREGIARKIGMREYEVEVLTVLDEFFIETDGGWINRRAQGQIQQYQGFKSAGARGAAKRWARGGDSPPITPPNEGLIANHKPITNNHKPKREEVTRDALQNPGFSEDFIERVWPYFVANKKGKYKNLKSQSSALRYLFKISEGDEKKARDALQATIGNGYQGFDWWFEREKKNNNGHKISDSRSEQDRIRAAGFEFTRQLVEEARAREARERDGVGGDRRD